MLLADEGLVLILDDTEHVWERHRANLLANGQKPTLATVLQRLRRVPGES